MIGVIMATEDQDSYESVKRCIDSGECEEAKRLASTYLGIDPGMSQAILDCAETRDSEACAKASAQLAATAACTYMTGGAGAYLCNKYAPQIVDAIWPVLGPPLVTMFDIGFGFIGATYEFFKGAVESFGKMIGIVSSPGVDWDDVVWRLKAAGRKAIGSSSVSAIEAISSADVSTRLELGLSIDAGSLGTPKLPNLDGIKALPEIKAAITKNLAPSQMSLIRSLKTKPAFAGEVRVAWPKFKLDASMQSVSQWVKGVKPRVVSNTYWPTKDELMLQLWGVDLSKWNQSAVAAMAKGGTRANAGDIDFADFKVVDSNGAWPTSGKTVMDLQAAFGLAVSERVKALQAACSESVGDTIGVAIAEKQGIEQAGSESGSGLLWLLGLAGAGTLLYLYRDKVFK
ncbi:MAG: hypothetical protein WC565_04700 [Parcubacteria group bacterium]